jgi:hypothetical protein
MECVVSHMTQMAGESWPEHPQTQFFMKQLWRAKCSLSYYNVTYRTKRLNPETPLLTTVFLTLHCFDTQCLCIHVFYRESI